MTVTVEVVLTLKPDDYSSGWGSDPAELAGSVRATVHEFIGDDGGAYVPHVVAVIVDGTTPEPSSLGQSYKGSVYSAEDIENGSWPEGARFHQLDS